MSSIAFKLTPRITLYAAGSPAPSMDREQGWLAFAQLPPSADKRIVFGDGSHPTTRLCAGVVDLLCRLLRPESVLDVGTGTGVLARIARARGARFIVGTDIDPMALESAHEHCALDVSASCEASDSVPIHLSSDAPDSWGARFDLVVANILEEPLRLLAPSIARAVRPGGVLLLSGFTRPQTPALRLCYESAGLTFLTEAHLEEWSLLRFTR